MKNLKLWTSLSIALTVGCSSVAAQAMTGTTENEIKARQNFTSNELPEKTETLKSENFKLTSLNTLLKNQDFFVGSIIYNKKDIVLFDEPNINSKKKHSLKPQVLRVSKKIGNFYQVQTWLGQKWVLNKNNVLEEKNVIPFRRQLQTFERVNLYNKPFDKYKTYDSLSPQTLQVVERAGDYWFKVKTFKGEKWIYTTLGVISEPPVRSNLKVPKTSVLKGTVNVSSLNVRNSPNESSTILGKLPKNHVVEILANDGDWSVISYNKKTSFVASKYLDIYEEVNSNPGEEDGNYLLYSKGKLKLYKSPSSDYYTGASISPQVIKSTKRIDKYWYEVNSWLGKVYVNIEESSVGYATDKRIDITNTINIKNRAKLYEEPFETHPNGGSIDAQTVTYIAKVKNYRLIQTWIGPKWIKVEEPNYKIVEEVPKTGSYSLVTSKGTIYYKDANLATNAFEKIQDKQAYLNLDNNVINMKQGFVRTKEFTIINNLNGQKATYVATNTEMDVTDVTEDKIYVSYSGTKGYIQKSNGILIPLAKKENRSSYIKKSDGKVYHRIYNGSGGYYDLKMGYAPAHLKTGVSYYTYNPKRIGGQDSYQYFMYYPIRMKATYTAQEIDNFIKENSPNSPLIGTGKYFIKAANKYNLHVGYFLSHAIHESAWGTSKIAKDKNNLFGFKAVDSNPYDGAASFKTLEEGILYCAEYISKNYINTEDWRYSGGFVGDKAEGMNVNYASDAYWGEKIASYMHRLDSMYGNRELNKYPLGKIEGSTELFLLQGNNMTFQKKQSKDTYALKLGEIKTPQGTFYKITADDSKYDNNLYIKASNFKKINSY